MDGDSNIVISWDVNPRGGVNLWVRPAKVD